jgi:hypothetical protein
MSARAVPAGLDAGATAVEEPTTRLHGSFEGRQRDRGYASEHIPEFVASGLSRFLSQKPNRRSRLSRRMLAPFVPERRGRNGKEGPHFKTEA